MSQVARCSMVIWGDPGEHPRGERLGVNHSLECFTALGHSGNRFVVNQELGAQALGPAALRVVMTHAPARGRPAEEEKLSYA